MDFASKNFPNVTSVSIIPADSNNKDTMLAIVVIRPVSVLMPIPASAGSSARRCAAFVNEVQRLDPGAQVTEVALKD